MVNSKSIGSGAVEINDVAQANQQVVLSDKTITTIQADGSKLNVADGDWSTYWGIVQAPHAGGNQWSVDLGTNYSVTKVRVKYFGHYLSGAPGGFLTVLGNEGGGPDSFTHGFTDENTTSEYTLPSPQNIRYVSAELGMSCEDPDNGCPMGLYGLEVYKLGATATHITGSTQLDGGANFWQWENFTDTKTVPANTSVTYRFRTSTNGSDWTGWVGSIGAVTSRTGDPSNPTKYRYLQIEATLANTDGASTPTVDQYDIGYHTNQPPNKPTAMTAVVQ